MRWQAVRLRLLSATVRAVSAKTPLRDTDMAKAAGLAAAQIVATVAALGLTVTFARELGTVDYGSLARMFAILVIILVPGSALQVATVREAALGRMGHDAQCAATLRRWIRGLLAIFFAVTVGSILLRVQLAQAMSVNQVWGAALVLPTGALFMVVAVQRGVLQGLRSYRPVGISLVGEQIVRLLLGLGLIAAGGAVTGAFAGTALAVVAMALALQLVLHRRLGRPAGTPALSKLRHLVSTNRVPIIALTLFAVVQNVDVVVVGHTLSSDDSGAYAVASIAAKGIVWVSIGLGLFLLPEATRGIAAGRDMRHLLLRTLGMLSLVAIPMVAVYAVAAEPLLRAVFGGKAPLAAGALPWLGLAMSLLACSYLSVQFLFARHHWRFVWFLAAAAIAEPVALLVGGDNLSSVAAIIVVANALLVVVMLGSAFASDRGQPPTAFPGDDDDLPSEIEAV